MRIRALTLLVLFALITGCISTSETCKSPYLEYQKGTCCKDADNNGICDRDETTTTRETTTTPTTKATATREPATTRAAAITDSGLNAYENPNMKFRLEYPNDWTSGMLLEAIPVFYSPQESATDNYAENVNIVTEDLTTYPGLTLEEYYDISIQNLEKMTTDFKRISKASTTLGGRPAVQHVISHKVGQYTFKQLQVIAIKGDRGYSITYSAMPDSYDRHYNDAMEIVNSFEFT